MLEIVFGVVEYFMLLQESVDLHAGSETEDDPDLLHVQVTVPVGYRRPILEQDAGWFATFRNQIVEVLFGIRL